VDLIIDGFDRLFRPEDGIEADNFDLNNPIIPQLEKFDGSDLGDLEEKWIQLFNAFQGSNK